MKKINLDKAEVSLLKDGLIQIKVDKEAYLEKEDMQKINAAKDELAAGKKYCVVFIPGKFANISNEAMKYSASKEVTKNAIAKSIVINSFSARLIGNFFVKFMKPHVPIHLFEQKEKALEWLEQKMKQES